MKQLYILFALCIMTGASAACNTSNRSGAHEDNTLYRMIDSIAANEEMHAAPESCRLLHPLKGTGAAIGHKTGTSDQAPNGRYYGINDIGFVRLLRVLGSPVALI